MPDTNGESRLTAGLMDTLMRTYRKATLTAADLGAVENLVRREDISARLVTRFIAGETLEEALPKVTDLAAAGITTTLDELGENVSTREEADAASRSYVAILRRMRDAGVEPNISIKLTMLGLDLGDEVASERVWPILDAAREVDGFVRIDMEGSTYTARSIALFETFHDRYPDQVGIVLQSYLHRTGEDVERMIERRARVRLVKGAYAEPATVAIQDRDEVNAAYKRQMKRLLKLGAYPAIATHDPAMISATREYAEDVGITLDRFEFQMLYGVRRDAQLALREAGYRMRVYVPYGTEWYPYFSRRIAEKPSNALFVLRQMVSG